MTHRHAQSGCESHRQSQAHTYPPTHKDTYKLAGPTIIEIPKRSH